MRSQELVLRLGHIGRWDGTWLKICNLVRVSLQTRGGSWQGFLLAAVGCLQHGIVKRDG